jgi:hypothetical protein
VGVPARRLFSNFADPPRRGLEISDCDEEERVLSFDLLDLLDVLGEERVGGYHWICQGVECSGPGADALHAADDDGLVLSGETLWDLATHIDQTIEGLFLALPPGSGEVVIGLRAMDSTWWEVWTADDEIHEAMLGHFDDVQFIEE